MVCAGDREFRRRRIEAFCSTIVTRAMTLRTSPREGVFFMDKRFSRIVGVSDLQGTLAQRPVPAVHSTRNAVRIVLPVRRRVP